MLRWKLLKLIRRVILSNINDIFRSQMFVNIFIDPMNINRMVNKNH